MGSSQSSMANQETEILCICKQPLIKTQVDKCYGGSGSVVCDGCDKTCPKSSGIYVYHCGREKINAHERGYDLCVECADGKRNKPVDIQVNYFLAYENTKTIKFEKKQKDLHKKQQQESGDRDDRIKHILSFYKACQIYKIKEEPVKIWWYYDTSKDYCIDNKWKAPIESAIKIVESKVPGITFSQASDGTCLSKPLKQIRFYSDPSEVHRAFTKGNVLNYDSANIQCGASWSSKDGTALHELLHALGAQHEHKRKDRKNWGVDVDDKKVPDKKKRQYETADGSLLTRFDPHSIMNYSNCRFKLESNLPVYFSGTPLQGKKRLTRLSPLDELGMNILYPPAKRNDNKLKYDPKRSHVTGLWYCGREGATDHINYPGTTISTQCGPDRGPNCAACRVLKNEYIKERNEDGDLMWQGSSGRFYCGKFFGKQGKHHDGNCGPNNGTSCSKCKPYTYGSR